MKISEEVYIETRKLNHQAIEETIEGFNLTIEELNSEDEAIMYDFYTNVNLTKRHTWND